jgi:hypothetical protein
MNENEKQEVKPTQEKCCCEGNCEGKEVKIEIKDCGCDSSSDCCTPSKKSNRTFNIIIFSLILLAAIVIGAYSLKKSNSMTNFGCGPVLTSVESVNQALTGKDALIILLANNKTSSDIAGAVEQTKQGFETSGKKIEAITVTEGSEAFNRLRKDFSINDYPSIVVIGGMCGFQKLTGAEINSSSLQNAVSALVNKACNAPCGAITP